jgi:ubiquinone/menaquinone biosynthesis C-methylase UbiE
MTLTRDVVATRGSRWEKQEDTLERIKKSIGTIVSVYRSNDPWWSPALAQSLSVGVPVVTDWRLSSSLGMEWSYLASAIEEMPAEERFELANRQKASYIGRIMSWEQTSEHLLQTINLSKVSV